MNVVVPGAIIAIMTMRVIATIDLVPVPVLDAL